MSFELDQATVTCKGEEPLMKILSLLENEVTLHLQNGELVFDLADGVVIKFGMPA
jgi:hypothetical protein